jgi:hypothetical protein
MATHMARRTRGQEAVDGSSRTQWAADGHRSSLSVQGRMEGEVRSLPASTVPGE